MFKNKIVAVGLASMLAMPFGLVACGGQSAAGSQSAASAASTASTASAASTQADSTIIFWQGTLSDGQSVFYCENEKESTALLAIAKADASDGKAWTGKCTLTDNVVTITDETEGEIKLTVVDTTPDFSALKINIDGYGEVELKPTTQGEFSKEVENYVSAAATAAVTEAVDQVSNELSKTTLYWEGKLADGSNVVYQFNAETNEAVLAIGTEGADAKSWTGKATTEGDKTTITDESTKQTISFTGASGVTDKATSAKLNIDGYGEVEIKPVTGGDLAQEIEKEAANASSSATSAN